MRTVKLQECICLASRELTYPIKVTIEDDSPLPKVGYVSSMEGISGSDLLRRKLFGMLTGWCYVSFMECDANKLHGIST